MVIDLVCSSIIMLPYCKSLWQNPISWLSCERVFSNVDISSSRASRRKASASSEGHILLAVLSHFLKQWNEWSYKHNSYSTRNGLEKTTTEILPAQLDLLESKTEDYRVKEIYLNLSHRSTFFGPGMSRSWNSFILAAIRADISGSSRSEADSVWNFHMKYKK